MTDYKKDFPLLAESDIAYLDNAATEQRPACVLDAEREFYERWNANPLRGLYELGVEATEQYEHARERVARFVHAKSEREIIFTRNTTEGINLVAYSYALPWLKPGDEILVTITATCFRGRWRPDEPEPRLNIWSVNRTAVLRRRKSVMPSHRTQSLPR